MAEAFGIVSGAVGIAAIFSTCVECFDYIQIGWRFGKDFQTEHLTLSLLKLRLSRWGEAVHIYDDLQSASKAEADLAKNTLYQILVLLADSEKVSSMYRLVAAPGEDLSTRSGAEMEAQLLALDNEMRKLAAKRQKKASLVKLASWALYDKKHYSELIEGIDRLLSHIEKLFPASEVETALVAEEVKQLNDAGEGESGPALRVLMDVATSVDTVMAAKVVDAISARGTSYGRVTIGENARVNNGDFVSSTWKGEMVLPTGGSSMTFGTIQAAGTSRVQNGNTYADKDDFWN